MKQTLIDYPGKMASIMFTSTCNLACPWCQNGPVVRGESPLIPIENVFDYVENSKHKNLVISGGEPTIQRGLIPFLRLLKKSGISVKLDTNGTNPQVLEKIFNEHLIDYIAMDIKGSLDRYKEIAGKYVKPEVLKRSIEMIKNSGVPYQFRTTVVPGLVDLEDLVQCKKLSGGNLKLQKFRKGNTILSEDYQSHMEDTEEQFDVKRKKIEEIDVTAEKQAVLV